MILTPRLFTMTIPADFPIHWYDGNPLITSFFGALSVLLPDGERFLIATLREAQRQITDPNLKQEISGFIGQEAHHSQAHRAFNHAYLEHHWVDLPAMEADFTAQVIEPMKALPLAERLAYGAAIEHFTALFGEHVLLHGGGLKHAPNVARAFVLWHAIEELEHKSVVFDAFQQISNNDLALRRRTFRKAFLMLSRAIRQYQTQILRQADSRPTWRARRDALRFFFGTHGLMSSNISKAFDYLKADFHPSQHQHDHLLEQWPTRYPLVMAYLNSVKLFQA